MISSYPCVMTIAGSDSGGGAGIQADLKTFSALGVYPTTVLTALTAQNTKGVREIFPLPANFVKSQAEAVLEDIKVEVAKTGMLYSSEIMSVVAEIAEKYNLKLVVDPVFRAGSGDLLIKEEAKDALIKLVVPKAYILTPNRYEAEDIAKMSIETVEDMEVAAQKIAELGAKNVVVKGGHLNENEKTIKDVLYVDGKLKVFTKPRLEVKPHGSGCSFSAAIAAYLALGNKTSQAVEKAERFIQEALSSSLKVGTGRMPVNPMAVLYNEAEKYRVLENVRVAARMIEENSRLFMPYVAEVGIQVAMATSYATNKWHVAAVEGRIVRVGGELKRVGCVSFGASSHLARIVLTAMKFDSKMKAALNLHHHKKLVEAFKNAGFTVSSFDRAKEPEDLKKVEGKTLSWGVEQAIKAIGRVPDVIYDFGEVGKEPMIRVLGVSATNVVEKALAAIRKIEGVF